MKKIILAIFATCFIVSLSAQESVPEHNNDLIAASEVESTTEQNDLITLPISKKTVKIAALSTIVVATAYQIYKSRVVTNYAIRFITMQRRTRETAIEAFQEAYSDPKRSFRVSSSGLFELLRN